MDAELLNLGKVLEPNQVLSRWTMEMSIQNRPLKPLPPEMTIAEVFELPEVGQQLLILGEPGSGKTTTLLELTQTLVKRALEDTDAPIPVLVNLSSWKDPKQEIFDWLLEELKSKYGLRQELGGRFLRQNQLLPCLDGLDEVAPIRQETCAVELNKWLTGNAEQRSIGVVVCCRREEYEKIVRKRLFLENSVALQPLGDTQIEAYLKQFQLGSVWESVQASSQLQDLLRKPLFLAVFGFVAPQFDFEEWQWRVTDDKRMEYLFDRYWNVAMDRALVDAKSQNEGNLSKTYGKKKLPERKRVRRAIVFVAKAMEQETQTEILIEKMQPNWLRSNRQKWLYKIIVGLIYGQFQGLNIGLTLGMLFGLFYGLFWLIVILIVFLLFGPFFGLIYGLIFGLIFGRIEKLVFGLIYGLKTIQPIEAITISISSSTRREILHSLRQKLNFSLIGWLIFVLISGLIQGLNYGLTEKLIEEQIVGLIGWLILGLIGWLIEVLKADIEDRITPNQGIKNSRQNMLILTGTALLTIIPLKLFFENLIDIRSSNGINITTIFLFYLIWAIFLEGGGKALIQHIALRIVLACNGYAPYRYDKLLDYCTERLLLQRIGGRYRFMHKLLQEHFAKMPLD